MDIILHSLGSHPEQIPGMVAFRAWSIDCATKLVFGVPIGTTLHSFEFSPDLESRINQNLQQYFYFLHVEINSRWPSYTKNKLDWALILEMDYNWTSPPISEAEDIAIEIVWKTLKEAMIV